MAPDETVPSFDDIIQADRLRRKHEALANEIFGKGRRSSVPLPGTKRKPGTGPSLASRVGVAKRSASSAPKLGGINRHRLNNAQTPRFTASPRDVGRLRLLENNLMPGKPQFNGAKSEITIRGLAGPYVVVGSNFAPGTTSADIQSAMGPVGGEMLSCRIVASSPTVVAEMTFTDKAGAENVIATFNNQKADGRLLYVYMKHGPPAPVPKDPISPAMTRLRPVPTGPKADRPEDSPVITYDSGHARSDKSRIADPEYQDGSYGFGGQEEKMDVDVIEGQGKRYDNRGNGRDARNGRDHADGVRSKNNEQPREVFRGREDRGGLYSDNLYSNQRQGQFPSQRGRGFR